MRPIEVHRIAQTIEAAINTEALAGGLSPEECQIEVKGPYDENED